MSESEVNLLQWSRKNRWKVVGVLEEDGVTGNGGNSSYMESFIKTDVPFAVWFSQLSIMDSGI